MKCQDLLSLEKKIDLECHLLQILHHALKVKKQLLHEMLIFFYFCGEIQKMLLRVVICIKA